LFIGLFQALAILPGISRSGATIAAGLWKNLRQETAFYFSFYLAIPAIIGALVLQMPTIVNDHAFNFYQAILGVFVAGGVGYLSLMILKKILSEGKLWYFSFYCLVLSLLLFLGEGLFS
jgi:undecaprenyl-diphosphatase